MKARVLYLVLIVLVTSGIARAQWVPPNPTQAAAEADTNYHPWYRYPIEGFVFPTSVRQGDNLDLYVSVNNQTDTLYSIRIYNLKDTSQAVYANQNLTGHFFPLHDSLGNPLWTKDTTRKPIDYRVGCKSAWEEGRVSIPTSGFESGVYFVRLFRTNDTTFKFDAPFVVRAFPHNPNIHILYKFPINTYQAYNYWGGASLYTSSIPIDTERGFVYDSVVTMDRPIRQDLIRGLTYASNHMWFLQYADTFGYEMEFCDNRDVDIDNATHALLSVYKMIVGVEHDEYWSLFERDNTEYWFKRQKSGGGGNLLFLSANSCYWRVRWLDEERRTMRCIKDLDPSGAHNHPNNDLWRNNGSEGPPARHPEGRFMGSQFQTVGNEPDDALGIRQPPMTVTEAAHWIYKGTNLQNGDSVGFGADPLHRRGIIGGEIDNTECGRADSFLVTLVVVAQESVLSYVGHGGVHCSDTTITFTNDTVQYLLHQAVYYEDTISNARVFNAGTLNWCRGIGPEEVDATSKSRMKQITANLIDHFSGKKYIGEIYSKPETPLEWESDVELDGNVYIVVGKYLKATGNTIAIDTTVILFIDGTLEINDSVTIAGKGQINLWHNGKIKLMPGATLRINRGVFLDIENSGDIEFGGGSQLVIEGDALAEDSVSVTVESGGTLTMLPGSAFHFRTGAGLAVSGTLDAQGISGNRIAFLRHGSEDYWPGITLSEGSEATVNHCDIRHAQIGINANTVVPAIDNTSIDSCKVGASMFQCAGSITNSTFTNNIIKAIIIDGENPNIDEAPLLTNNFVSSNTTGIYITNSAPTLERNTVTSNSSYGIWCDDGGNPFISRNETDAPGNNILENNGGANLLADDYSFPFAGYAEEENGEVYGGYNSFGPEKHQYDIWAGNESEVTARKNFWSEYPPEEGTSFREDSYAWIDWDFPLDSYGARPLLRSSSTIAEKVNRTPNDSPGKGNRLLDELLAAAMAHRSERRFGSSMGLIRQYIAQRPIPPLAPLALVMLHQIAEDSARAARSSTVLTTFASYLDSLLAVTTSDRLKRSVLNVAKNCRVRSRNWQQAMTIAETIATQYPHTTLEEHALYTLFSTSLFGLHHRPDARQALSRMQQQFPESQLTALAELLIEYTVLPAGRNGASTPMLAIGTSPQSMPAPARYALYQNFPNPFNPSTTIKYDLPVDVHVTLNVYDVLGREVTMLVDENIKAGYNSVVFDGSGWASGVYFYRIHAGDFSETKKFLLLR